jgi:putative membrane protein
MTSWKTIGPLIVVGAATLGSFGGCTKANPATQYPTPGASQGDEPAPGAEQHREADVNDRQIVGVLTTVDAGEIEQARVALTRATDPRVKQFAAHMVDQHTESTQQASTLASQYDLMPSPSDMAKSLQDKASRTKSVLDETSEGAFDVTYMQAQIQQHQEVLEMLKSQLAPAAHNEALGVQLRAASSMVQNHLSEARAIAPLLHAAERTGPAAAGPAQPEAMPEQ